MKRKSKKTEPKAVVIRVWTFPQAKKALPYISSVMRSAREHWLDAQGWDMRAKSIQKTPGRLDRQAILAKDDADREGQRALDHFHESLEELRAIEVFCLDPARGLGVVPFVHQERLAWLLYDLFDSQDFREWRYHDDEPELRRPIAEATEAASGDKETTADGAPEKA